MVLSDVLADLDARGLVADTTDREELAARLASGSIVVYCGFDPTADSLHVGNLQSLLLLRRFQDHGHRPICLAGGATAMIGDPSGRDSERNLLDTATISANLARIQPQLERFLSFDGDNAATMVDNRTWTERMSALEFLRDVGKNMTINTMLQRDSVKSRLDRDTGLSFTEFSYMLLQANDFAVLNEQYDCELQVAGSDQWGNIVSGLQLIRKRFDRTAHGLTAPLITSADGKKFGKSTGGGGLWLDAERTSPYQLYQYFMATDDRDVESWLLRLTLLEVGEINDIVAAHEAAPHERAGQRALAAAIVELVHGPAALEAARSASEVLFGGDPAHAPAAAYEVLAAEVPTSAVAAEELAGDPVAVLSAAFGESKGRVRKNLAGFKAGGQPVAAEDDLSLRLVHGRWVLLSMGKRNVHLLDTGQ